MSRALIVALSVVVTVLVGVLVADVYVGACTTGTPLQGYIAPMVHAFGFVACVAFGALVFGRDD
jgi:hypothetical protein